MGGDVPADVRLILAAAVHSAKSFGWSKTCVSLSVRQRITNKVAHVRPRPTCTRLHRCSRIMCTSIISIGEWNFDYRPSLIYDSTNGVFTSLGNLGAGVF